MAVSLPSGYSLPSAPEELLAECDITCFQASGPGGQHRNRTKTAVRLKHRPSGIVVIGRRERSQGQNRKAALARLRERLVSLLHRPPVRVPTRPSRVSRERRLTHKRARSRLKKTRQPPSAEE